MEIPKNIKKLELEHKVIMGAKNGSTNDMFLLVYLSRKKEFATYFYNKKEKFVTLGHYTLTATKAMFDLFNRASKNDNYIKVESIDKNTDLLETAETNILCN